LKPARRAWAPAALVLAALALAAPGASAPVRVMSVDQCADQYVLALAPRPEIVGVSKRALNPDSNQRALAQGLPERRPTLESVLAAQPTVVVRYWTADAGLGEALMRRGVAVVQLDDPNDFPGIARNIRVVAKALGREAAGEALVARMNAELAASQGAWRGARALYLTPGGFTAGDGTLVGATMRAAGLTPEAKSSGYGPAPLETLVLNPPVALVLAFFRDLADGRQHWAVGDAGRVESLTGRPVIASLSGTIVGCPAWFAADGALALARAAPPAGR
jgi:iron complex transport system substrate-binding protein